MKKAILLVFVLAGLNGYAQDFKIDSTVTFAGGIKSVAPNYVKQNYHMVTRVNDSIWTYQAQFFTYDSLGHRLLPNDDLIGARSSRTVKEFTITSEQAELTPDSLRKLFYLPYLKTFYGNKVEAKKPKK